MSTVHHCRRVLIVEDDLFMREALSVGLTSRGFDVEARGAARGVPDMITSFRPEMLVLDVGLPDGSDGISLLERIRASTDAGVLFISGSARIEDRLAGFAAGGDDFLAKPFSMEEFFARVEAIHRRTHPQREIARVGEIEVDEESHTVRRAGHEIPVTPIEFTLLTVLCRWPGRVYAKAQLLDLVWGYDHYDVNLVEVHVHALRRKLEQHGPRVIHTVRGVGYVLRDDDAGGG